MFGLCCVSMLSAFICTLLIHQCNLVSLYYYTNKILLSFFFLCCRIAAHIRIMTNVKVIQDLQDPEACKRFRSVAVCFCCHECNFILMVISRIFCSFMCKGRPAGEAVLMHTESSSKALTLNRIWTEDSLKDFFLWFSWSRPALILLCLDRTVGESVNCLDSQTCDV